MQTKDSVMKKIILICLFGLMAASQIFDQKGVQITFPGNFHINPSIGNLNKDQKTYSYKDPLGIFSISFSSNLKNLNKTSLEELMHAHIISSGGGVSGAEGQLINSNSYYIDGYPSLVFMYYNDLKNIGGPVVLSVEQVFKLDSHTLVNIKFVGSRIALEKEKLGNFFNSLKIKKQAKQ